MNDNAQRPAWFPYADALHRAVVAVRAASAAKRGTTLEAYDHADGEFLAMGLGGEAGEVLNEFKKWMRGDYAYGEFIAKLATELADVRCMLELVARYAGLDLDQVTPRKLEDFERKLLARGWIKEPVAVRPPPGEPLIALAGVTAVPASTPPVIAEPTTVTCRPCGGTGKIENRAEWSQETCAACQGKGSVEAVIVNGRTFVAGG